MASGHFLNRPTRDSRDLSGAKGKDETTITVSINGVEMDADRCSGICAFAAPHEPEITIIYPASGAHLNGEHVSYKLLLN